MPMSMREQLRDQSGSYLPRLLAVFFAVFDPIEGPKVVHQVPEGSVATALSTFPTRSTQPAAAAPAPESVPQGPGVGLVRSTSGQGQSTTQVLFDFSSIIDFVIPKPELCGHLITKATRSAKILGFPVRIFDEKKYHKDQAVYNRNAFVFNLCFVFERDAELSGFEPVVRKTARTLRTMEESVSLLSSPPPTFEMANLLEQLYMDINTFSETSISLHDTDLDLMLFPFYANPREVNNWDVPITVTSVNDMKNGSWDVTLFKVCSFIDGVNNVKRIAELAEVELNLGRLCIQHLLFYSAIVLVDLFQFSNSYAVLPGIADIAQHGEEAEEGVTDLRSECEAYVYSGTGDEPPLPFATLLSLYSKLSPKLSISSWMEENAIDGNRIDVRRMIQFGVIKGFLRRVYAYPIWLDHPSYSPTPNRHETSASAARRYSATHRPTHPLQPLSSTIDSRPDLGRHTSSIFSGDSSNPESLPTPRPRTPRDAPAAPTVRTALARAPTASSISAAHEAPLPSPFSAKLPPMLDGTHHTDEICVGFGIGLKQLEAALRMIGGEGKDEDAGSLGDGLRRVVGGYGSRVVMLYV